MSTGRKAPGKKKSRHRKGRAMSRSERHWRRARARYQRRKRDTQLARGGLVPTAQALAMIIGGTHPTIASPALPEHTPRSRSSERIDSGFVRYAGWQIKYEPTPERSDLIQLADLRRREDKSRNASV